VLTALHNSRTTRTQQLPAPNMPPSLMPLLRNMWHCLSTLPVPRCSQTSTRPIVEDSLLVSSSRKDVVQERIQEEPSLAHHLILLFPSPRTLMQDTPRLFVLNVKMLLEALLHMITGKLNRPEIVQQLWLDKTNLLHTETLKLHIKLSHLYTWLQPPISFSLRILMLLYAVPSLHAPSRSLGVLLTTLELILSSMLQLEK